MSLLKELAQDLQELEELDFVEKVAAMFEFFDEVKDHLEEQHRDQWVELLSKLDLAEETNDEDLAGDALVGLQDILDEYDCNCSNPCFEVVYVNDDNEQLDEAQASVAYRARKGKITKKFRCTSGEKKGRLVANPKTCITRKNPKRVVVGRRVASSHKGLRLRKSKLTRSTNTSKMARKMNMRLKHHGVRRPKSSRKK